MSTSKLHELIGIQIATFMTRNDKSGCDNTNQAEMSFVHIKVPQTKRKIVQEQEFIDWTGES